MKRHDEVELLAEFLNGVCVDWPPISMTWSGNGLAFSARRNGMRELAFTFLDKRKLIEEKV